MSKIFDEHQKRVQKNATNSPTDLVALKEDKVFGNVPCHDCNGMGKLNEEECNMCAGTGSVPA